jgi:hypothetical protein
MWAVLKFELVRWSRASGTIAVPIGAFILAVFLALFNYLTPSGRVTPNVTGQTVARRRWPRRASRLRYCNQTANRRRHTAHLLEQANTLVNYCRASRFI